MEGITRTVDSHENEAAGGTEEGLKRQGQAGVERDEDNIGI